MRFPVLFLLIILAASGVMAQGLAPAEPPVPPIPGLPSTLSGVGATPLSRNVNIRTEPSADSPIMGRLLVGRSLDVVGTNGYDLERSCTGPFAETLDMWVQVQVLEERGWVARCTVHITGDGFSRLLVQPAP